MSAPDRHAHDQLRADLLQWSHGAAVFLRENPGIPEQEKKQILANVRVARHMLDCWDRQPRDLTLVPV